MSRTAASHYLAPLFEPASVAIVGASETSGSVGAVLAQNMVAAYRGPLYAVNPKRRRPRRDGRRPRCRPRHPARRGLRRKLMELLIEVARARGLKAMIGHILGDNRGMLELCGELGFAIAASADDPMLRRATLPLAGA